MPADAVSTVLRCRPAGHGERAPPVAVEVDLSPGTDVLGVVAVVVAVGGVRPRAPLSAAVRTGRSSRLW